MGKVAKGREGYKKLSRERHEKMSTWQRETHGRKKPWNKSKLNLMGEK